MTSAKLSEATRCIPSDRYEQLKFHEAMASHGGRLPWELLPPIAKALPAIYELAQALLSKARQVHPRLPRIHFDFINSNEINGIACKKNGEYFIGITGGAVTLLQLVFHRMLADPTLFSGVGDNVKEVPNPPHIKDFTPNAIELQKGGAVATIPKDEIRWSYSCRLTNLGAMFLVGHEIAHIACGHVDYLSSSVGAPFLMEFGLLAPTSLTRMERQVMEGQADQYSFNGLLAVAQARSIANSTASTVDKLANLAQLIFDNSFAVNSLFRLFGDERFIGKDLTADWYPPIALRRRIIFGGGCGLASRNWTSEEFDVVAPALEAGMFAADHAFAAVVGEPVSAAGLKDALSDTGREHFKLLSEFGDKEVAAKLKPFGYDYNDDVEPELLFTAQSAAC